MTNQGPSDVVEKVFYGSIDDYWGRVIPTIRDAFSKGQVPTFEGAALRNLQGVIFEMVKRTPDFLKGPDDVEVARDAVKKTLDEDSLLDEDDPRRLSGIRRAELGAMLSNESELRRQGRDLRVRATILPSTKSLEALSGFQVRWARSNGKHSFVLSSLMAYRIGNGGSNGLVNPDAEIWFPISPKIALVLVRDRENKIPLLCEEPSDHMREVNLFALENSSQIGSHSKTLLWSLLQAR